MGMVTGFTVQIELGINADSEEGAKLIANNWIKALNCPVCITGVKK